jgi:hypothetical protein
LVPAGYELPDEFVDPVVGNSLDLIPLRVRQDVLSEVFGWLQSFLEIDANLISLMWRQPNRLQAMDWIHVCSKMGLVQLTNHICGEVQCPDLPLIVSSELLVICTMFLAIVPPH